VHRFDNDIDENMLLQQRMWKAERIGWVILVLFIILLFSGFLGKGPMGYSDVEIAGSGYHMRFPKIERLNSTEQIRITLLPKNDGRSAVLLINSRYFRYNKLLEIVPAPVKESSDGDYYVFEFNAGSNSAAIPVVMMVTPLKPGTQSFTAGADRSNIITVNQFVYP
jgi:hypothetical protein